MAQNGRVEKGERRAAPGVVRRLRKHAWRIAAFAVGVWVVLGFTRFQIPGLGLTYLLDYGDQIGRPLLPELAQVPHYVHEGAIGYDACSYSQLALRPAANDPALYHAIDNVPFRARRMLLPWIAWTAGLGRPEWVLNVYAALNIVAWCALAILLHRWLPLAGAGDFLRWVGVMLSAGALSSLSHALTDLPALVGIAFAVALLEMGRPRLAALATALAGLTRETSVLAVSIFAPASWRDVRGWWRGVVCGALAVAPLAIWLIYLVCVWGGKYSDGAGLSAFAWPFSGYIGRWQELLGIVAAQGGWRESSGTSLLLHLSLTVQAAWIVLRPRWSDPWWRIAAMHVLILALLGPRSWEGFPGASARILLPLTLAFNALAPRTAFGIALLVFGNIGVLAGLSQFRPPGPPVFVVDGPADLVWERGSGARVELQFGGGFYGPENQGRWSWRWTSGPAVFRVSNPQAFPLRARMKFALRAGAPRAVELRSGNDVLWSGTVPDERLFIELPPLEIAPGGREISVVTGPPDAPPPGHPRALAVRFYNIEVTVEKAAAQ